VQFGKKAQIIGKIAKVSRPQNWKKNKKRLETRPQ
jgi:hypothetical protein